MAYIVGLTIITLIDKRLGEIKINIPKQNVNVKIEDFEEFKSINNKNESLKNNLDNKYDFYSDQIPNPNDVNYIKFNKIPEEQILEKSVCIFNHFHKNCDHGSMNYPDPYIMNPIDKIYHMNNIANNFTKQDYINWLWLHNQKKKELPYEHLKNLNKLEKGDTNINFIFARKILQNDASEYFDKMYNLDINFGKPFDHGLHGLDSANEHIYNF